MTQIDITPSPRTILGKSRDSSMSLAQSLAEIIDNSFDAGARRVKITADADSITVEDDGRGCADLIKMLRSGDYHGGNRVGQFGQGLKDASIALGGALEIESVSEGRYIRYVVDWDEISQRDARQGWMLMAPEPMVDERTSFMRIRISRVAPKHIRSLLTQNLSDSLALTFAPALKEGRIITIAGEKVTRLRSPRLRNGSEVEYQGEFQGLHYKLTAGISDELSDRKGWRHGYHLVFRHRILTVLKEGFGEYGCRNLFAYLELLEPPDADRWPVFVHKDGVANQLELVEYLLPFIEPLLQKLQKQWEMVHLASLNKLIESQLQQILGGILKPKEKAKNGARAKKSTDDEPGAAVVPRGDDADKSAGPKKQRKCDDNGEGKAPCSSFKFDWNYPGPELGNVDLGTKYTHVHFHMGNQYLKSLLNGRDHLTIAIHAAELILTARQFHSRNKQSILFEDDDPWYQYLKEKTNCVNELYLQHQ